MMTKRQTVLFSVLTGVAVAGGAYINAASRHDPRFDDVDALLEKAALVLSVADCTTTEKAQRECERHAQKALDHINSARAGVADAMVAADSGDPK
jgi:hypothetical protein